MDFTTADFKAVMGRFATGVTVVTTALGSQRAGITVNAFCSVSLDPPLVLVCIERTAHIHDLLIEAGVFAVNLLAEGQDEVARCFAVSSDRRNTEFCGCETGTSRPARLCCVIRSAIWTASSPMSSPAATTRSSSGASRRWALLTASHWSTTAANTPT